MTAPEQVQSWRDLIGELSPDQVERLEDYEADPGRHARLYDDPNDVWTPEKLLKAAQHMAAETAAVRAIGNVPPQPDAISVGEWTDAFRPSDTFRAFTIAKREIGRHFEVETWRLVPLVGPCEREIRAHAHPDNPMDAQTARLFAAALIAAAEDLEPEWHAAEQGDWTHFKEVKTPHGGAGIAAEGMVAVSSSSEGFTEIGPVGDTHPGASSDDPSTVEDSTLPAGHEPPPPPTFSGPSGPP